MFTFQFIKNKMSIKLKYNGWNIMKEKIQKNIEYIEYRI